MSIPASPKRIPVPRGADPVARTDAAPGSGAALRLVDPGAGTDSFRDPEHVMQGRALALESHCLRQQAARAAAVLDRGGVVEPGQIGSVMRAFRAYRPFLFARDRARNDDARRRLARAVTDARGRHPDTSVA